MSSTLATAINGLNEKGIKYKVETQETGEISMAFGLLVPGERKKIIVVPTEETIAIRLFETEKEVDEAGLAEFLDNVLALKALQKQEAKLVEALKA